MNNLQLLDEVEYNLKNKSEIKEGRGLHNSPYHLKAESNNCFITHSISNNNNTTNNNNNNNNNK